MSAFSLRVVLLLAALKLRGDSGRRLPGSNSEAANIPAAFSSGGSNGNHDDEAKTALRSVTKG